MNMERNVRGENASLLCKLCERRVTKEISSDYLIPDSQPEARRILAVTERLLPPAKYVGASSIECNGVIDYRVIYLGADGGLWGCCFSSEYELEAPVDARRNEASGGVNAMIWAFCEDTSARISAGRRLTLKSRIGADIWAYCEIADMGEPDGVEYGRVEKLVSKATCAELSTATSEIIELSDEVAGLVPDSRVISADATAHVVELRRGGDSLLASGDVTVKLLICGEGRLVDTVIRKIHFEGVVELDGAVGGADCRVDCAVTDLAINLTEGRAEIAVSAVLTAYTAENSEMSYVADAYSVERECRCEVAELELPVSAALTVGNFSQSERCPLSETDFPEGARLIDAFPRVLFSGCEYKGRYELTGKCVYLLLWEKNGEYGVSEIEFPVKYEAEGKEAAIPACSYGGEVISCRVRVDGELLCIDSEICARLCAVGSEKVELVRDVTLGEEFAKEKNRMVIYYPADGETPWEVAKKYHVRADSLSEEKNYYMF